MKTARYSLALLVCVLYVLSGYVYSVTHTEEDVSIQLQDPPAFLAVSPSLPVVDRIYVLDGKTKFDFDLLQDAVWMCNARFRNTTLYYTPGKKGSARLLLEPVNGGDDTVLVLLPDLKVAEWNGVPVVPERVASVP